MITFLPNAPLPRLPVVEPVTGILLGWVDDVVHPNAQEISIPLLSTAHWGYQLSSDEQSLPEQGWGKVVKLPIQHTRLPDGTLIRAVMCFTTLMELLQKEPQS